MDDVRAVMDAVGSERAALFGVSEGGNMSVLFAATYPERTVALVTFGGLREAHWQPGLSLGADAEERAAVLVEAERDWGGDMDLGDLRAEARRRALQAAVARLLPREREPGRGRGAAADEHADRRARRAAGDPRARRSSSTARTTATRTSRRAARSPRRSPAPASSSCRATTTSLVGDAGRVLDEIEEFLTGARRAPASDRVLATVLFTDIVGSTERRPRSATARWRDAARRATTRSSGAS